MNQFLSFFTSLHQRFGYIFGSLMHRHVRLPLHLVFDQFSELHEKGPVLIHVEIFFDKKYLRFAGVVDEPVIFSPVPHFSFFVEAFALAWVHFAHVPAQLLGSFVAHATELAVEYSGLKSIILFDLWSKILGTTSCCLFFLSRRRIFIKVLSPLLNFGNFRNFWWFYQFFSLFLITLSRLAPCNRLRSCQLLLFGLC